MVMTYFMVIYSFGNTQESQEVHCVRRLITRLRFDWGAFNVQVLSVTTTAVYSMSYLSLSSSIMHLMENKLSRCTGISRFPLPLFSPITVGVMFAKRLIHARIAPPSEHTSHVTACCYSRAKRVVNAVRFQEFSAKRTEVSDTTGDMSLFRMNIWIAHHSKKPNQHVIP
jgi:hypothetical protein